MRLHAPPPPPPHGAASRPAPGRPLASVLRESGAVSGADVLRAERTARRLGQPLPDVLLRRGVVDGATLAQAMAAQAGLLSVDLTRHPGDPALCAGMDPRRLIAMGVLPWRRFGRRLILAVADPGAIPGIRALVPGMSERLGFVVADRAAIETAIGSALAHVLVPATRDRCPEAFSCRAWAASAATARALALFGAVLLAAALLAPGGLLAVLLCWIALSNLCTTGLRAFALAESFRRPSPHLPMEEANVIPLPSPGRLPVISLLVPLYHEGGTLRHLISALERNDYPKELLDVILVLEEDDIDTPLALARIGLPPWARIVTVPQDALKTKPRAMNYALEFCRGGIVGIYDAEDRPEPTQLSRVARHLAQAPDDVACVQGYLDFYNSRQNWLARCFAIEYAIWFRVLLGGVQRLGMPIPLGGTTVFFRRSALEAAGGWDSHNVTEDADLGMRLARLGYRTEMVDTTTFEEANCRPRPWIAQRSRWLKGYAITWATHMRDPAALWRDLGPAGFLGFQILLLGGLTAYLATPLLWLLWAGFWGWALPIFDLGSPLLWTAFFASMLLGQGVMLAVALRAVWDRPRRHLLATVPPLLLYWPLGAIAAWRAVGEILRRPFYWAKTHHGL